MNDAMDNAPGSLTKLLLAGNLLSLQAELLNGGDVEERDIASRTLLLNAAIDNQLKTSLLLIRSGAKVNASDSSGFPALHFAAQNHRPEMARLLIDHGAIVEAEDVHGNTPLCRATFESRGRGELISILLAAGANRNRRNKSGRSPLELAMIISNYNIIQFFE